MSKSKVSFLFMKTVLTRVSRDEAEVCDSCGDPDCGLLRREVHAWPLQGEENRGLAMAGLDGDPQDDYGTPMQFSEDGLVGVGSHYRGGDAIVFEIHQDSGRDDLLQLFTLNQSRGIPVVWQAKKSDTGLDAESMGISHIFSYGSVTLPISLGSVETAPVQASA